MPIFPPPPRRRTMPSDHNFLTFTFFSLLLIPSSTPLSFTYNFSALVDDTPDMIDFQGDAFFNKVIKLTKDKLIGPITSSTGRAVYGAPIQLYDAKSGHLANFATRFSFVINATDENYYGDGLAFFLSPFPSRLPENSAGGYLGLFNHYTAEDAATNEMVAVEFDTYKNDWDPSSNHVGINLNTINSTATRTWGSSMRDGRTGNAWVNYDASSKNLSVFLTYDDNVIFLGSPIISYIVDLRELLPEEVAIGFSAATGQAVELHKILYWEFSSDLEPKKEIKIGLLVILIVGIGVIILLIGLFSFVLWKGRVRRRQRGEENDDMDYDELTDEFTDEFEQQIGPRRFLYSELLLATNNFADAGKLGEGGFGAVYRGVLRSSGLDVAIKRISKASKQGKKEYVSEVKIISQLRHRNLVRLLGWCHDRADFLLVYELMPNGSLDSHLYRDGRPPLTWPARYRIALGLASAVLYLHEEWDHCVVHRDIKPSNVMLDSGFNAKLGDFGLARLVDHDGGGGLTTVLAGTIGYLAPECITTGNSSKESDVYSFGVVALEIACGRRQSEPGEEPSKVRLVPWVWEMYGRGVVIGGCDARLNGEFEEQEMKRLMVVGLWCAHPDCNLRPSMRQAISVLKLEASLPSLPLKMPAPMFYPPLVGFGILSYALTEGSRSTPDREVGGHASSSSSSSSSSNSSSSSERLLQA